MAAYQSFASVYDRLMDNIPYDRWTDYIEGLLNEFGEVPKGSLVLDLACGTGNITERLASRGFDMIGVDNSSDMLDIANEKKTENDSNSLYLLQDMTEFELYGTVAAAVSICDSINYLLSGEEVVQCMKLVNNYLDPEGIFVFDFNTDYYYKNVVGDSSISEVRDDVAFIWENEYDPEERINSLYLTLFLREDKDEYYRRYDELHLQRGYDLSEIKKCIELSGLVFEAAFDAFTREEPKSDSERIYVVAREAGKKALKP
ncbi:MAG: class I SAM-dependent methyltransferase [Eubacterium sp.]|nr:class I SAM-dependent methyltransferase [Eubacterium sp.]